jgi:hypothetical protein
MPISHILLALIVSIGILLMLVRPRDIPEVYWIGGGALLLLILQLIPLRLAGKAAAEGSDVYLFLIGMMLLSELARDLRLAILRRPQAGTRFLRPSVYPGLRHWNAGHHLHVQ